VLRGRLGRLGSDGAQWPCSVGEKARAGGETGESNRREEKEQCGRDTVVERRGVRGGCGWLVGVSVGYEAIKEQGATRCESEVGRVSALMFVTQQRSCRSTPVEKKQGRLTVTGRGSSLCGRATATESRSDPASIMTRNAWALRRLDGPRKRDGAKEERVRERFDARALGVLLLMAWCGKLRWWVVRVGGMGDPGKGEGWTSKVEVAGNYRWA
jgi:hypothetical protein